MSYGLIDAVIYFFSDVVFGNATLFAIMFMLFCAVLLIICRTHIDSILVFMLVPIWFFKNNLLAGAIGIGIVGVIVLFDSYILFKNIQKFIN
jgi:hypothetical protein